MRPIAIVLLALLLIGLPGAARADTTPHTWLRTTLHVIAGAVHEWDIYLAGTQEIEVDLGCSGGVVAAATITDLASPATGPVGHANCQSYAGAESNAAVFTNRAVAIDLVALGAPADVPSDLTIWIWSSPA